MCLGIPAKVIKINGELATVQAGGTEINANIQLVPEVKEGEYVILHAGFAIQVLDEQAANETLELLKDMEEQKVEIC
jgi:hydrogenase expression/formation protein HypC